MFKAVDIITIVLLLVAVLLKVFGGADDSAVISLIMTAVVSYYLGHRNSNQNP